MKKENRKTYSTQSLALGLGFLMALSSGASFAQKIETEFEKAVAQASKDLDTQAAQLLMFNAILNNRIGEVVEIPADVREKYESYAISATGAVQVALAGAGAGMLARKALKDVEFVSKSLNRSFTATADLLAWVREKSHRGLRRLTQTRVMRAVGEGVEWSSEKSEQSYRTFLQPIVRLLVNKNTALLSASVGSAGVALTSSVFFFEDSTEAMDWETLRHYFGYNAALDQQVDALVADLAQIYPSFSLNHPKGAERLAALKPALKDELLRLAIENRFRDDAPYRLELADLLKSSRTPSGEVLISDDEYQVVKTLALSFDAATQVEELEQNDLEFLNDRLPAVVALAAHLEATVQKARLNPEDRHEALALLKQFEITIKKVTEYFKK